MRPVVLADVRACSVDLFALLDDDDPTLSRVRAGATSCFFIPLVTAPGRFGPKVNEAVKLFRLHPHFAFLGDDVRCRTPGGRTSSEESSLRPAGRDGHRLPGRRPAGRVVRQPLRHQSGHRGRARVRLDAAPRTLLGGLCAKHARPGPGPHEVPAGRPVGAPAPGHGQGPSTTKRTEWNDQTLLPGQAVYQAWERRGAGEGPGKGPGHSPPGPDFPPPLPAYSRVVTPKGDWGCGSRSRAGRGSSGGMWWRS
jgi:hypothetical protein